MSDSTTDRLYHLLPAIYRARDETVGGEALRALLGVIQTQFDAIHEDIATLYDNWFIETCQDWVVPYIGDLLGVRELNEISNGAFSRRAYVANTFAYRQRKGTPAVVEQLARDVTGWPARVVEYFQLLATTQYLEHLRPGNQLLDLRDSNRLELIGGAFERAAYSADVRRISSGGGRYNIPNVGIFLWRLGSYPIVEAPAGVKTGSSGGEFTFSRLGNDIPLFNRPQTETSIISIAQEVHVPGALRRRPLFDELEAYRDALLAGETPSPTYFGSQPVFEIFVDDETEPVAPELIQICNLADWRRPEDGSEMISVDPVLGRITLASDSIITSVRVSYSYGFSADIGGGSYNRRDTLETGDVTIWKATVAKNGSLTSLGDAVGQWENLPYPRRGIIEIADSEAYDGDFVIDFSNVMGDPVDGEWLVIQARDGERPSLECALPGLTINAPHSRTAVTLNGLLVHGHWLTVAGDLGELTIKHCTFTPGGNLLSNGDPVDPSALSIVAEGTNVSLLLNIDSSIVGPLRLPTEMRELKVNDSILDGLGGYALCTWDDPLEPGPKSTIVRTTVLGKVAVKEMTLASEVIFSDLVQVDRRQIGCIRFSFVPEGSRTPRRYRCVPKSVSATVNDETDPVMNGPIIKEATDQTEDITDLLTMRPVFNSIRYGTPAYAQLSLITPLAIRAGTEDGSEMGAFNMLKYPQRETNLRIGLDEYLRLGVDTGIIYVT